MSATGVRSVAQPNPTSTNEPARPQETRQAPGLGVSALELAAQRGIGPLSALAAKSWHGESKPCPSCGQLIRRTASVCDQCGQDLSPKMLLKMQAHCGPWYVLEHVRPFPGVTLERLVLQARRGVLTPTTIIRGPTTYHQWRFAAETPALSKHLGVCWRCQGAVAPTDQLCPLCRVNLDGEMDILFEQSGRQTGVVTGRGSGGPTPAPKAPPPAAGSAPQPRATPAVDHARQDDLGRLSAAVQSPAGASLREQPRPATIAGIRVHWIIVALVVLLVAAICWVAYLRSNQVNEPQPGESRNVGLRIEDPQPPERALPHGDSVALTPLSQT
jgi:hypothetical protein